MKILHITNNYRNEIIKDNPIIRDIIYGVSEYKLKQEVIIPKKTIFGKKKVYVFNNTKVKEKIIPIWGLPYGFLIDLRLILSSKKVQKFVDSEFNIIHAHSYISDGYIGYKLSKKYNKPLILSITGTDVYEQLIFYPHLRVLAKRMYEHSLKVISRSYAVKKKFLDLINIKNDKKIKIIPNGIKEEIFLNSKYEKVQTQPFKLIFIGRLVKLKNLQRTILAIKALKNKGYNINFEIIGDGPLKEKLNLLIKNKKLENNIQLLGKIDNNQIYSLIKKNNALIMCSIKETFGMVYIEALSQYRPIIYSENRGVDGIFKRNVGIKCNPLSIKSIENAIEKMINNYDYYLKEVKEFNKEEFKNFTIENTIKKYYELYMEVKK
ncbi:glycosyltransferase family 4 protein [Marinitoga arctica]